MKFYLLKDHWYYDLVRIPHGHFPGPLIPEIFKYLPIPAGKKRDDSFYSCPECGRPTFFKITKWCKDCKDMIYFSEEKEYQQHYERWQKRKVEDKRRLKFKKIEIYLLPILIILGLARYNKSIRKKEGYDFIEEWEYNLYSDSSQRSLDEFMEVSL